MGRRFSLTGMAACLIAGLALWFTRASLDVTGGPVGEVRVAMFPSWAELAGLITLASIVIFLLRSLASHVLRDRRTAFALIDPLLPLFALVVLGAPYLPWAADAAPSIRLLAGPARFALWAIVVGHVVWLTWSAARASRERSGHRSESSWILTLWVLAVGAIAFGAAATLRTRGALHLTGDEPHYLVVAQSVLRDGDLRVDDNYRRGDYREYYAADLKPEVVAADRDGPIYTSRPIGLPLIIAPVFAVGGYAAVTVFLTLVAAATAAVSWRWAAQRAGSTESATVGWLAVAGAAPWVLHSFSIHPQVTAGAVVLFAVAWTPREGRAQPLTLLARGCLVGTLPWLSATYAPMSAVLTALLVARQWNARETAFIVGPYALSVLSWLAFLHGLGASPLPTPLLDSSFQAAAGKILAGLPALVFDQEYGLLPYAPALLLAAPGLWQMVVDGGTTRRLAIEIVLVALSLAFAVCIYVMGWGSSSVPGSQMVAVLPLCVMPIARWDAGTTRLPVLNAAGRGLVLVTLTISAALLTVRGGLLAANRHDGSSQLLEWLAPSFELVRVAPSFPANRELLFTPLLVAAVWLAAAVAMAALLARVRRASPGVAAAVALLATIGGTVVTATTVSLAMRGRVPPRLPPHARPESAMLSSFDSRARPLAVKYDHWQRIPPEDVPGLFRFEGRPGMRRDPQPVRVLLNTRLALPAGLYAVELKPSAGAAIDGDIALQLGRTGEPVSEWPVKGAPGEPWSHEFRLDVDTPFVGFRTSRAVEDVVGEVIVRPRAVINAADRLGRRLGLPPVLAAAHYGDAVVYFHDNDIFPEPAGFWVRGASDAVATFVRPAGVEPRPIRVRVHAGPLRNRVQFSTGAWQRAIDLAPSAPVVIEIPILHSVRQAAVLIVTAHGFVPAETTGGRDRRFLGCWVEVIE